MAATLIDKEADLSTTKYADLSSDLEMSTGWPTDRPTKHNPPLNTDGLDPAAIGGPSPLNGTEPLGTKVVTDPLVAVPQKDMGGSMPHTVGPDVDTTTLKNYRQFGGPVQ
jgi:hypothetical protein